MQAIARFLITIIAISMTASGQTAFTDTATGHGSARAVPFADSSRPAGIVPGRSADSAQSLKRNAAFDSLDKIRSRQLQQYMAFPTSLDSVFNPVVLRPDRIQNSNATGLSEIIRVWPQVVAVPFALSSSQSRFLLYGFPLLTNAVYSDGNVFGDCADAIHGTDGIFTTQVNEATLASPMGVRTATSPYGLVAPHTDVLWENGVFLENLLGVRFVRPLTKTIDVGLYSDFRHLAPFNYSTANDIKSLYSYFFSDTTLVANGGRNPLSNESRMTLSLASHPTSTSSAALSYSYIDSKNDQAIQLSGTDTGAQALRWRTLSRYANILQAEMRGLPLSLVSVNIDGSVEVEGHRLFTPVVNSALVRETAGRNSELRCAVEPYVGFGADTFSVFGRAARKDQQLYDASVALATTGDIRLGYRHTGAYGPLAASLALTAGDGAVKASGKALRHDLVYSAHGTVAAGMQRLHVFWVRDHLPFVLPYDSLSAPLESYDDAYQAYGADIFLGYGKIGLAAGVCAVSGVDTSLAGRFWSDGMMPYGQPSRSFMLTPMIGRVLGFALSSRTMFSDRKPYVKSQSTLSYQANPIFGREYITTDLMFDYWSSRDPVSYGGINIWNREIFNLSLSTAVHIQGFCLFYKIDNILNRKFAYVPGYFMPGLTFRWGFQWLIPG